MGRSIDSFYEDVILGCKGADVRGVCPYCRRWVPIVFEEDEEERSYLYFFVMCPWCNIDQDEDYRSISYEDFYRLVMHPNRVKH